MDNNIVWKIWVECLLKSIYSNLKFKVTFQNAYFETVGTSALITKRNPLQFLTLHSPFCIFLFLRHIHVAVACPGGSWSPHKLGKTNWSNQPILWPSYPPSPRKYSKPPSPAENNPGHVGDTLYKGFPCDVISHNFASHRILVDCRVGFLNTCHCIGKTTKSPITVYLLHSTIPNYNRVTVAAPKGAWGAFAPQSEALPPPLAPTIRRKKMANNQPFLAIVWIFAPPPPRHILPPRCPPPQKNCSGAATAEWQEYLEYTYCCYSKSC